MKRLIQLLTILGILFIIPINSGYAQWTSDPAVNTTICDLAGFKGTPQVAVTTDGKYFVSWFGGDNMGSHTGKRFKIRNPYAKAF
ncbi:MAG: hypothetical protein NT175_00605 [Bacteroidetes bacterium]|nr:hypothetical protein [Bacteroidota bacterium]